MPTGTGGRILILVLYTCMTREMLKKGCFFETEHNSQESRLGGQKKFPKILFRGKIGCETMQSYLFRGVFSCSENL